jgi:1-acyl-sn-glycerol-3-phosphate acyltransferase
MREVIVEAQRLIEEESFSRRGAIRRHLRAIARLVALWSVTVGIFLVGLGAEFVSFLSPATGVWLRVRALRLWARSAVALLGMQLEVRGTPPLSPSLLVANHLSYVDILLLATQTNALFVAKAEVATWPAIGLLCRSFHTIFIDRKRKRDLPRAIAEITTALREGRTVVLFPEGTSTAGTLVLPFRSSLFEAAAHTGVQVSWASLTYRTAEEESPASHVVCWWGKMTFIPHLYALLQLPRFRATVTFSKTPLVATSRKTLAARAWVGVAGRFTPVTSRAFSLNVHYPVTILSHGVRDTLARRSEPPGTALCQTPSPERHGAPGDVSPD